MKKVLLVDDNDAVRKAVRKIFVAIGTESVIDYSEPRAAYSAVRECNPEVVVSDFDFCDAEIDGLMFLLAVQVYDSGIKKVLYSGNDIGELRRRGEMLGLECAYLQKPLSISELKEAIDAK